MSSLDSLAASFEGNLKAVQNLIDFDHTVLEFTLLQLRALQTDLDATHSAAGDRVGKTLHAIEGVRKHDSMRRHYSAIYNQCAVLMVSHFEDALRSLFIATAPTRIGVETEAKRLEEELKFSLAELCKRDFYLKDSIGELILAKKGLSFQDMRSTTRAFQGYLGFELPPRDAMDDIIFAQAARHAIVHNNAIADDQFMRQITAASQRSIGGQPVPGAKVALTPADLAAIAQRMQEFVQDIVNQAAGAN